MLVYFFFFSGEDGHRSSDLVPEFRRGALPTRVKLAGQCRPPPTPFREGGERRGIEQHSKLASLREQGPSQRHRRGDAAMGPAEAAADLAVKIRDVFLATSVEDWLKKLQLH